MKNGLLRFACLVSVSVFCACSETDPAPLETAPRVVEARTVRIEPGSWQHKFKTYGLVTPAEEFEIGVEVNATVKEVLFREGQAVQAGDILLRLDDRKLRLRLDAAMASLEEARAQHDQATSTYERNRAIYESGVISEQAFRQSESQFKSSQAILRRATSNYDLARQDLSQAELRSPVSGVVTRRETEPGQNVSAASRLGVIQVMDAFRVETFVSQKDINHIAIGMPATVTSPGVPGQVFAGRVDQVASSAEPATGNFEVGVMVEDAGGLLRDGMSAMVEFSGSEQENMLAVPRAALVDRGRRLVMYRLENGVAHRVEPALGVGNAESVPVLSGLEAGDEIIVSHLNLVSDGQSVQRINPEG